MASRRAGQSFHEVSAVDSVVDIIAAAQLISLNSRRPPDVLHRCRSDQGGSIPRQFYPYPHRRAAPAKYRLSRMAFQASRFTAAQARPRHAYLIDPREVGLAHSPDVSQRHRIKRSNLAGRQ